MVLLLLVTIVMTNFGLAILAIRVKDETALILFNIYQVRSIIYSWDRIQEIIEKQKQLEEILEKQLKLQAELSNTLRGNVHTQKEYVVMDELETKI
jgi:hypothetical protein